jgi:aminoglycoside phosphotransferase
VRLNAEARLRDIAAHERDYGQPIALPEPSIAAIEAAADLAKAAEDLLEDIRRRHPGEDFTCPFIINLSTALDKVSDV